MLRGLYLREVRARVSTRAKNISHIDGFIVATLFTNCTFWTRRVPLKVFIAVVVARKFQTPLTKNLINKVGRYILS